MLVDQLWLWLDFYKKNPNTFANNESPALLFWVPLLLFETANLMSDELSIFVLVMNALLKYGHAEGDCTVYFSVFLSIL